MPNNGELNREFLNSLDSRTKNEIITSIAKNYGVNNEVIVDEVTDVEAESIMDYLSGGVRTATYVFYKAFLSRL